MYYFAAPLDNSEVVPVPVPVDQEAQPEAPAPTNVEVPADEHEMNAAASVEVLADAEQDQEGAADANVSVKPVKRSIGKHLSFNLILIFTIDITTDCTLTFMSVIIDIRE